MARKKANEVKTEQPIVKPKNPGGRPSKYTSELAKKICKKVATTTSGLRRMCQDNSDFPCVDTLLEWRFDFPEFSALYDQAKKHQADLLAEDILDIADDDTRDDLESESGTRLNTEWVARSRLRMDARKWLASKLLPKAYGDKVVNETNVTFTHEDALKELK